MSIDELVGLLNRVYGYDFKLNDDGSISYTLTMYDGICDPTIQKEDVQSLLEFDDSLEVAPVRINSSDYNEFLLRDNASIPSRFREARRSEYTDRDNHVV